MNKDRYATIKNKRGYILLLESGMFWETFPELTGIWEQDYDTIFPPVANTKKELFTNFCDHLKNNYSIIVNSFCIEHYLQTKKQLIMKKEYIDWYLTGVLLAVFIFGVFVGFMICL
jgi:hypothetical protein